VTFRAVARNDRYCHDAAHLGPYSIGALLATLVLLFAFQGQAIVDEPLVIAMLAVPILLQVFFNSGLAYLLNRRLGVAHCVAGPSSLSERAISSSWRLPRRSVCSDSTRAQHWYETK
jgi:ACR3 family arsenite transporter